MGASLKTINHARRHRLSNPEHLLSRAIVTEPSSVAAETSGSNIPGVKAPGNKRLIMNLLLRALFTAKEQPVAGKKKKIKKNALKLKS